MLFWRNCADGPSPVEHHHLLVRVRYCRPDINLDPDGVNSLVIRSFRIFSDLREVSYHFEGVFVSSFVSFLKTSQLTNKHELLINLLFPVLGQY